MEPLLDQLPRHISRNKTTKRFVAGVAKFVISMIVMTITFTWVWEAFLDGKVYQCTDGPACYLSLGDWVHSHNGYPVVVVHQIVPAKDMSDPDTLKEGWSITGLWCVWILFFGASVMVSIVFAWVSWIKTLDHLAERCHGHAS